MQRTPSGQGLMCPQREPGYLLTANLLWRHSRGRKLRNGQPGGSETGWPPVHPGDLLCCSGLSWALARNPSFWYRSSHALSHTPAHGLGVKLSVLQPVRSPPLALRTPWPAAARVPSQRGTGCPESGGGAAGDFPPPRPCVPAKPAVRPSRPSRAGTRLRRNEEWLRKGMFSRHV